MTVTYDSYTDARTNLKHLLDTAEQGEVVLVVRGGAASAVVNAEVLRRALAMTSRRASVVAEDGHWSAFLNGFPIGADGATLGEAIDELVQAMREYAEDWTTRLRYAPNHRDNAPLVWLTMLSSDDQLRAWLVGEEAT